MEKLNSYKDLKVWQKSMDLVEIIYKITEKFGAKGAFGLVSQMRRAAVSVPSNIAEGYQRGHRAEYVQFLAIAQGSCAELETQLEISRRLEQLSKDQFIQTVGLLTEVMKMLHSLKRSLKEAKR